MQVQLLTHTPEPEKIVAAAARLCYSDAGIDELLSAPEEQQSRLIEKILSLGHFSVLEHVSFSFGIEGVSRACSHQLVRHRLASYSQQSQRYVSHSEPFAAVEPDSLQQHPATQLGGDIQGLDDRFNGFAVFRLAGKCAIEVDNMQ
jgi:thymidylate synthase (FAD)